MVRRLTDFAFVVFKLLMFKLCRIICISKIEFFKFSGTERLNICPKKPQKTSLWKNDDVIMDSDPLHLRNHTLLDHSSEETFDQHWITVPTVYRMTRFRRKHFAAEKMPMSAPMWLCKVSLLTKNVSCDIIMKFWKFYAFVTNWSISQKLCSKTLTKQALKMEYTIRRTLKKNFSWCGPLEMMDHLLWVAHLDKSLQLIKE